MAIIHQGRSSLGMEANLAALLSYLLGFITGIIFYALEKDNKFVRFHAMQSIVVFACLTVLKIATGILPIIGYPLSILVGLTGIVLWIILMIKACQGEYFKLPFAGAFAEKNS